MTTDVRLVRLVTNAIDMIGTLTMVYFQCTEFLEQHRNEGMLRVVTIKGSFNTAITQ